MECGSYEVKTAKYTCFSPVTNKQKEKNFKKLRFNFFLLLYLFVSYLLTISLLFSSPT